MNAPANASRFVRSRDMTDSQIVKCGYEAMSIVALCEDVVREEPRGPGKTLVGEIAIALALAHELMSIVQDRVAAHEEAAKEARRERAS